MAFAGDLAFFFFLNLILCESEEQWRRKGYVLYNLMTLSSWRRPFVSGNMKKMTGRKRRRTRPKARKVPERLRAACRLRVVT
jgi:hypothetical protein